MFREDVVWLIPAVLIALVQVKFIWAKTPDFNKKDTEIPGEYSLVDRLKFSYLIWLAYSLFFIQLVFPILIISRSTIAVGFLRIFGYFLVIAGFLMAVAGLKTLGQNWSGMDDYRIKKDQALITSGVYRFVRHPIYAGAILEIIGFELVANSWLALILGMFSFYFTYRHILKEEGLLEKKFGETYRTYRQKTKIFLPYLF